jgi:hypothetical protein
MPHDRTDRDTGARRPDDNVEVWGRTSDHHSFLEGHYGAETDAQAQDARAGGSLVTPTEVETEHLSARTTSEPSAARGQATKRNRDAKGDPLSHGLSRTATHLAGTDIGRTPEDPSGQYESADRDRLPPQ